MNMPQQERIALVIFSAMLIASCAVLAAMILNLCGVL